MMTSLINQLTNSMPPSPESENNKKKVGQGQQKQTIFTYKLRLKFQMTFQMSSVKKRKKKRKKKVFPLRVIRLNKNNTMQEVKWYQFVEKIIPLVVRVCLFALMCTCVEFARIGCLYEITHWFTTARESNWMPKHKSILLFDCCYFCPNDPLLFTKLTSIIIWMAKIK